MEENQPISDTNKYSVPALEKGLDILEVLADKSQPVSLTELARHMARTPSELFRLLAVLEARGYVNKNASNGAYTLSLKLYSLAHQHLPEHHLLDAATAPMERFASETHESCHISVLRFGKMYVLKEALTPGQIRLSIATGGQLPLLGTSSGRLLLAYQPPAVRMAFLEAEPEYRSWSKAQKQAFLSKLEEIRTNGLSASENENHIGVRDAAVPVGMGELGLIAALASTWLIAVSNPAHVDLIVQKLQTCARSIAMAMGLQAG